MIAKSGTYFGHPIILTCDANCKKAWGINNRPKVYAHYNKETGEGDPDDYCYLADGELGEAPEDSGVYEGDQAKPRAPEERLNKWCARECERCTMIDDVFPVTDFELKDFSKRHYNAAPHTRD